MLPKQNRLTSKYEFNKARYLANKNKTKSTTPLFQIFYSTINDYNGPTKVGIVVSNKICKSAVKRNKLKRIYREVIKNNFDKMGEGYWVVVHPSAKSLKKTYEEINSDFDQALQKISLSR